MENLKAGKYQEGSDQAESDIYTKVIPLTALYAGNPQLSTFVEQAVRTTLNTDRAVSKIFVNCVLLSLNNCLYVVNFLLKYFYLIVFSMILRKQRTE